MEPTGGANGLVPRSDLDSTVAEIWTDELGVETIGIHDTFGALGGDQETAGRLHARLSKEIKVQLPADAVHASQTIAKLTNQIIDLRYKAARHPTLVTIQDGGDRTPLFCVGGGGGYAFNFLSLAQELGPEQPVYGLHARGLESRARAKWTVEGHARHHLATIRTVQPKGPYLLCGYSFGGLVAYEIAQQLLADDEDVAHLAMIDTPLPAPDLAPRTTQRRGTFERVRVAVRTILKTAPGPRGRVKSCLLPLVGLVRFPDHHNTDLFWLWSVVTVNLYQITPYPGTTTIYLPSTGFRTSDEQWGEFLSGERRHMAVPGDHTSVMRNPSAAEIAADLAPRMREAVARSAGTWAAPDAGSRDAQPSR